MGVKGEGEVEGEWMWKGRERGCRCGKIGEGGKVLESGKGLIKAFVKKPQSYCNAVAQM